MIWAKYKAWEAKRIMKEAYREIESKSEFYERDRSDQNKQLWNYNEAIRRYDERLQEAGRRRKDAVTLMTAIITLPQDVRKGNEQRFFNEVLNYNRKILGEENLIFATIHYDELTPHIHMGFTPIKDEKLQCKNIMNRDFLQHYHKGLQSYLDKNLKNKVTVLRSESERNLNPHIDYEDYKRDRQRERELNNIERSRWV